MSWSEIFEILYRNDVSLSSEVILDADGISSVTGIFYSRKENKIVLTTSCESSYGKDYKYLT